MPRGWRENYSVNWRNMKGNYWQKGSMNEKKTLKKKMTRKKRMRYFSAFIVCI